jgi:acetyl esterase/lipase
VRTERYTLAETAEGPKPLMVDLYLPAGSSRKGAVLLVHGGSFITGSRDIDENRVYGTMLAERGYVGAAISYRLMGDGPVIHGWARNYARAIRESRDPWIQAGLAQLGPDIPEAIAASAEDVSAAVEFLREHADELGFDPDNIALFGASAGTISALTVAYAMDEYGGSGARPHAVVALRGMLPTPGPDVDPLSAGDPPVLILHGEADERLPVSYAESLFEQARRADVHAELFTAPGAGHELGGRMLLGMHTQTDETVLDKIDAFLSMAFEDSIRSVPRLRGRLKGTGATGGMNPPENREARPDSVVRGQIGASVRDLIDAVADGSALIDSLYGHSSTDLLLKPFDDPERTDWAYWPGARAGLPLRFMNGEQRVRTRGVLESLLSARGYLQVHHIMMLEEVLADLETTGFSRGSEDYTITLFGLPGEESPWGLRFEGHHVSLNITLTPDDMSVTPTFLGAAPAVRISGSMAGFEPLAYEESAAFTLLDALDADQRRLAILSDVPPSEILSSSYRVPREQRDDWKDVLRSDGVRATTFNAHQTALLNGLLDSITGIYRDEIQRPRLAEIDQSSLTFAWMGSTTPGEPHYFRIQTESFVFELDAAQEHGNHIHTVWRDRNGDFGSDALERHYSRHEH